MNRSLLIERIDDDKNQTLGNIFVVDKKNHIIYSSKCLELPWKHNQKRISCIPIGTYKTVKHRSKKFGPSLWLLSVPFRSEILIHKGNYNKNTLGCILPGIDFLDINKDGLLDVTSSAIVMNELLELLPSKFKTKIVLGQNLKYNE